MNSPVELTITVQHDRPIDVITRRICGFLALSDYKYSIEKNADGLNDYEVRFRLEVSTLTETRQIKSAMRDIPGVIDVTEIRSSTG